MATRDELHERGERRELGFQKCNLGMKRAILVGRKGPTTPVPSWRLYDSSFHDGVMAAVPPGRAISISARKLAARLWELQETPIFTGLSTSASSLVHDQKSDESNLQLMLPPSPSVSNPSPESSKHASYLGFPKFAAASKKSLQPNGHVNPIHSNVPKKQAKGSSLHRLLSEDRNDRQIKVPSDALAEEKLRRTSFAGTERPSEFLKVLSHIHNLEERHTSSTSFATALQVELEHARTQVQELELAHRAICKEMDHYLKKFAEERAIWRSKEKERINLAIQTLKKELDEERKSKRQLEMINTTLGRELGEANMRLSRTLQELERERKARELMEDVCDELAQEIGEGKAEVEELKVASAKVKEEVEQERKMLQMAEVWREERVQMKLAEARLQLQEKDAALDRLRSELEDFLGSRRARTGSLSLCNEHEIRKAEALQAAVDAIHVQGRRETLCEAWEMDGTGSIEEDFHSIDLNKGTQRSRDESRGLEYAKNDHQGREVNDRSLYGPTGSLKEQNLKTRRSRFQSRAKALARSRRAAGRGDSSKDAVTVNQHSVWESVSDTDTKHSEDSMINEENSERVDFSRQGSPTTVADEHFPLELTEENSLMHINEREGANYGLASDAYVWKQDDATSEGTSFIVEFASKPCDREPRTPPEGHSSSRTENPTHAISTLTSVSSIQNPRNMNQYFARCMKELVRLKQNDGRSKVITAKRQRRAHIKNRKAS
ncbi:hypothetical protein O6H91_09G081500 [Diphasiastrum complanatum]|uniref:Uncharacterized protein n=2 Tax=Diphasiastrum complanatum TaxID=34168 RepID=A0ACC2CR02_DIPCM|nr:hypothetical protein O6H91_09G081500 [Diphasiastrum complanatum]KAJ7544515.1 hypothetical protein O6H91_09G081500 [Diphasiastrum complanatum]